MKYLCAALKTFPFVVYWQRISYLGSFCLPRVAIIEYLKGVLTKPLRLECFFSRSASQVNKMLCSCALYYWNGESSLTATGV